MSYLPENYPASRETTAFQEALQPEVALLWEVRDDLLAQLDLYTATWGLDYWEDALGLLNGQGVDLDTRRRQIAAKLQGRATTTPQVVKDVAETLLGVQVRVVEIFGEYRVELVGEDGFRPGIGAVRLRAQLRDIMPAHLDWQIVIPAVIRVPIRTSLGTRLSETALPPRERVLSSARVIPAVRLGWRLSVTTLPMAAEAPPGGDKEEVI
mgnify:FL=1